MKSHLSMLYMFTSMFVVQYFFSSYIMTDRLENINNSTGKIYMCILMGLFMVLLDMLINQEYKHVAVVFGLIILFIYLYRTQFGVDDKNYLKEMIEHHSMALLTSNSILGKTKNPAVINFATKIATTQEQEIADMRYLLKSI